MSSWVVALALLGAAAYAVACHELMVHAAGTAWALALVLGPLVAATAGIAARGRQWGLLAAVAAAVAGVVWLVLQGHLADPTRIYLLQHVGVHLSLGASFAATLRHPVSMIGKLAQRIHPLTPPMLAYTRRVTLVWVGYFFGMSALSLAVHAFGSVAAWSLLANVVSPIMIATLFLGEYVLRYRINPSFERVPLSASLGAWRQNGGHATNVTAPESAR